MQGKSGREADAEINQMIQDLNLVDKANTASAKLSGGMKAQIEVTLCVPLFNRFDLVLISFVVG